MKDILEQIIAYKRIEVARQREKLPPYELYPMVAEIMYGKLWRRSMLKALVESPHGVIAEFKRKSPSKGWFNADLYPPKTVFSYEKNGAPAVSFLTDTRYFGGSFTQLERVRRRVDLPILCKDFIIDDYQIYQAKYAGADAVLLIAAAVPLKKCIKLAQTARMLRLETLLEIHSEAELDYLECKPTMVGVNNRNLGTFQTDVQNSFRLASLLPANIFKVSESGIGSPETIRLLRKCGYRGFLLGERFMREEDPGAAYAKFISEL